MTGASGYQRPGAGEAGNDGNAYIAPEHIIMRAPLGLTPCKRNARTHSNKQIGQIADSVQRFGSTNPVIVDDAGMILAGHGRVLAAIKLGLDEVPTLQVSHMSDVEKRAYILADNKLAMNAGWDVDLLADELEYLVDSRGEIDVSVTGFMIAEIDGLLDIGGTEMGAESAADDCIPEADTEAATVTMLGDLWIAGDHRLICGDARNGGVYSRLLQQQVSRDDRNPIEAGLAENTGVGADISPPPLEMAEMVFTDPPYNVPIQGHVMGSGRIHHPEFAMASGEMSEAAFAGFLQDVFEQLKTYSKDGSIHYICMDWRHIEEITRAGGSVYSALKNVIVWVKDNGGMGTFYRSRHELIFVFKNGEAPHINTFELGQHGRYRTNVWNYRGLTSSTRSAREELAMHPTVKPVAMVADAMKDCSSRGGTVLDAFCGSGTILIAAQKTGRRARAIEIDPTYCDTAIRRWQIFAKDDAILADTGETFDQVQKRRAKTANASDFSNSQGSVASKLSTSKTNPSSPPNPASPWSNHADLEESQ